MASIVESEIHEPRIFASIPPACLDGINVHTRAGIAEHELLWSSILLEHHQFPEDNVIHGNRPSPSGLAFGDENRSSQKVHVLPLKPENLSAPHARVKGDGDYGS